MQIGDKFAYSPLYLYGFSFWLSAGEPHAEKVRL